MRRKRSRNGGPRLSRIVTLGGVILASLTLVAAIASIALTSLMRDGTDKVQSANHAIRTAVDIHSNLLAYGRESALAALTGDDTHSDASIESQRRLTLALAEGRRQAASGAHLGLIDEIDRRVGDYFAAPQAADARQAALAASDAFVEAASRHAASVETRVHLWDVMGTIIGITVGVVTVCGVVVVLLVTHRLFSRPMIALGHAIRRFAAGERTVRARVEGAAESAEVARAFNELADELATEDQRRLAFLGGVAHDLRNPVSALRMGLHFVQAGRPLPPEGKVRDTFALVTRQITRLDRMLGDFLDAVRIQRGELDLRVETRDARELARNTVELYASASRLHTLALSTPDEPIEVAVDAVRMEQVLNNLVSNAIKYSPDGGTVAVTVAAEGEAAVISVADQGIGMAPQQAGELFAAFRRVGNARAIAAGAGLGLSVARRIVEAHEGTIEVKSAPGAGSTFSVRLPLVWPAVSRASPAGSRRSCVRG